VSEHRPRGEELIEAQHAVHDVSAYETEDALQIERAQ